MLPRSFNPHKDRSSRFGRRLESPPHRPVPNAAYTRHSAQPTIPASIRRSRGRSDHDPQVGRGGADIADQAAEESCVAGNVFLIVDGSRM